MILPISLGPLLARNCNNSFSDEKWERGGKPSSKVQVKKGDVIAVAVNKLELKNGIRRATCSTNGFVVLEKSEVDQLRS